jgi:hypothetical protein
MGKYESDKKKLGTLRSNGEHPFSDQRTSQAYMINSSIPHISSQRLNQKLKPRRFLGAYHQPSVKDTNQAV